MTYLIQVSKLLGNLITRRIKMNEYENHLNGGEFCTLYRAVEICRSIECECPKFGCHVALTGGTLYKDGERKDLDILFYRIRQVENIDYDSLFEFLM